MLRKLSVQNFRLLRDVTIDVTPGKPIVLIGPNASGKSSALQTLDLLARWADVGFVKGCDALGGAKAVVTAGQQRCALAVETDMFEPLSRSVFTWLGYALTFSGYVTTEELNATGLWDWQEGGLSTLSAASRSKNFQRLSLRNFQTGTVDELQIAGDKLSFEANKQRMLYPFLDDLTTTLQAIHIYDGFLTAPTWLRDPREGQWSPFDSAVVAPVTRIGRRGLDLVNALHHMQQNHGDTWDELMDAFRAEFPFVQRIEFPADPAGGRIALAFRDKRYPGERMQGHQMSEGMATYLCLLSAILAPEPAAALAFDEPDRHLHPSALRRIVHLLEKASERSAVFVATHSDRFLDYLSDPAGSIRICEPTPEGMKLRGLEADALEEWRKLYSISMLRERGQLDPVNSVEIDP